MQQNLIEIFKKLKKILKSYDNLEKQIDDALYIGFELYKKRGWI